MRTYGTAQNLFKMFYLFAYGWVFIAMWAFLAVAHGGFSCHSPALEHRLNGCGAGLVPLQHVVFLDQGWNPCLLHWQVESL